jgi:hypothetical protein
MPARKRELVDKGTDKRYVRREEQGQFGDDQSDVGRSSANDQRQHSNTVPERGQGDRGDRPKKYLASVQGATPLVHTRIGRLSFPSRPGGEDHDVGERGFVGAVAHGQRQLDEATPGTPEAERLAREADRLRHEYQEVVAIALDGHAPKEQRRSRVRP